MLFQFEGQVIKGKQNGRKIGFPTANVNVTLNEEAGTYIADGKLDSEAKPIPGILFIGKSETVNSAERTYELNIFKDFGDKEFYGTNLAVRVHKKIRENRKFNGLEDLKQQLAQDKQVALDFFRTYKDEQ